MKPRKGTSGCSKNRSKTHRMTSYSICECSKTSAHHRGIFPECLMAVPMAHHQYERRTPLFTSRNASSTAAAVNLAADTTEGRAAVNDGVLYTRRCRRKLYLRSQKALQFFVLTDGGFFPLPIHIGPRLSAIAHITPIHPTSIRPPHIDRLRVAVQLNNDHDNNTLAPRRTPC